MVDFEAYNSIMLKFCMSSIGLEWEQWEVERAFEF